MIEVQGLGKVFRDKKRGERRVVDGVSFTVGEREIFGLRGPNGAGKTTTLRMLATILSPTSGTATVCGCDVRNEPARVRAQLGFLSGDMGTYPRLTAREILAFFAKLNGFANGRLDGAVERAIERLEMRDFAGTKADKLSTGCGSAWRSPAPSSTTRRC